MIDGLTDAFLNLLEARTLALIVIAILFSLLIGILPGLGGAVVIALLIPVSYGMSPEVAVTFLIAAYSVVGFGGMITSILVNTPGDPENAATMADGFPMARQGRAAEAIGAGTCASVIGGLIGAALLVALLPLARQILLRLSYPEFFMMAILGLTVISVVTQGRTYRGLVAAGLGFMLAFIGLDPITGSPRFTFDSLYLWDGIDLVAAIIGLFAGAEVIALYGEKTSIMDSHSERTAASSTFWMGIKSGLRHWTLLVRGSILGTAIGIVPGVGGVVASFVSYGQAVQTSKTPERFGKGAVEGVIAAESANDAKQGGALLPTVAFGIPGSTGMAVLLGALTLHGVPAGPTMIQDHMDIVYALIVSMVVAKLFATVIVWGIGTRAVWFTRVRGELVAPVIVVIALTGAYALEHQILDVLTVLIFAYVGYEMRKREFSRVALIIAMVLGGLVERSYHQTLSAFGGVSGFVTRPIAATLLALTVVSLFAPLLFAARRRRRAATDTAPDARSVQWDGESR
ncbi:MAG: tripartite tricarboxylate transporter permease [Streptomycetales bacterium]